VPFIPGFGLFPAFVTLGLPGHPWPAWWATTAGALLGMGAHFANVLPDLPLDLATGVHGLPQRLGGRISRAVAGALLGGATAVLAVAPGPAGVLGGPLLWAGAAVAVVVAGTGVVSAVADRAGSSGTAGGAHGQRLVARHVAMLAVIAAGLFDVVLLVARGARIA
jgi:4-hydroxybenzoate polyprenyltransferase